MDKIENSRFKTNIYAIFLTTQLKKEDIAYNSLIPAVLRRGTEKFSNQLEIGKKLEEMYGANFNCGIDKTGNYQIIKFFIEALNDKYTTEKLEPEEFIKEIVLNPYLENGIFKEEYVEQEKQNIIKIIESRKDNKARYAYERCIEEMFENEPYGLYKYGTVEQIKSINAKSLYEHYKNLIKNCRIDVIACGKNLKNIEMKTNYKIETIGEKHTIKNKEIKEKMKVSQGKLIIGISTPEQPKNVLTVYNAILGGGANSKLFQNVRERAGLAYSAGSSYIRRKNAIMIRTGIETSNYDKAMKIIKEQLKDMKDGNITDDEFNSAKQLIVSSLKLIPEAAEDQITYYFDQKLYGDNLSIEEYIKSIEKVTKQEVVEVSSRMKIDTIYFLEGEE